MKQVCVFCASSAGRLEDYGAAARALGALLARRGIGIVYGGARVGLMGLLADAALAEGGSVVGIMPRALVDREVAHDHLTELRIVSSMHERKQAMHELSDAFIALPGGFGTLEELFETLTWGQLGLHGKPCGLLDVAGYFGPLLAMLDGAVTAGLLRPEHRAMLLDDRDPGRLLDRLERYEPPRCVPKWVEPGET